MLPFLIQYGPMQRKPRPETKKLNQENSVMTSSHPTTYVCCVINKADNLKLFGNKAQGHPRMTLLSFFSFLFDPSNIPHSTFLMHGSHLTSELFQFCFQTVLQIYYSKETSGVSQWAVSSREHQCTLWGLPSQLCRGSLHQHSWLFLNTDEDPTT